jgi:protease-4
LLAAWPLALGLLVTGCITIDTLGGRRQPLKETVVDGERGPKALLVDIDGLISDVEIRGPLGVGGREASVTRLREQLDKAEKKGDVKALLVRINSPGGTVTASDLLYRELLRYKEEHQIPVVAHFMGVAASGGYYAAMAADVVLAQPTSVTGSIGVISAGINVAGLMERFGVEDQTLTSGAFKDSGSPLRPMRPDERQYLQTVIDDLHGRFRTVVAKGRPALDAGQVATLADGRIFTASQAESEGLVDGIGYLDDAVDEVARRLGAEEIRVVSYHRRREWRANLYSTQARTPLEEAEASRLLGLEGGHSFLYLWWPGRLAP